MVSSILIEDVIFAPGRGAFFYDDQAAIAAGAVKDGEIYEGKPQIPGFFAIRMPAESLSIGLALSDGHWSWGDCISVQYSGAGGREAPLSSSSAQALFEEKLSPHLVGRPLGSFESAGSLSRELLKNLGLADKALEYGLSQALLSGLAHVQRKTITEIICEATGAELPSTRTPLYAQSGDNRVLNTDKMILKSVDYLPHGLINSRDKFGEDGSIFLEFVDWVRKRIQEKGQPGYAPHLYFDVYGWVGRTFDQDIGRIADFFLKVEEAAAPFDICIECPMDLGSRSEQLSAYLALQEVLDRRGCSVKVALDEWCNTVEDIEIFAEAQAANFIQIKTPDLGSLWNTMDAVVICKACGVGALLGGSCTETDISARVSANIALALDVDVMLAKPGMGVDEGISIVGNEQSRVLAQIEARGKTCSSRQEV